MPEISQLYIVISSNWTPFANGLATPTRGEWPAAIVQLQLRYKSALSDASGDRQGVVKVHYDEGVANRIEPEPCRFVREGRSEASVGAHRLELPGSGQGSVVR